MDPIVRRATLEDARAIARVDIDSKIVAYRPIAGEDFLANAVLEERAERWRKVIARDPEIEDCPAEVLVAEVADEVVAYSGIGSSRDEDGAGTGEVFTIYVHPSRWRSGVGASLLTAAQSRLREAGLRGDYALGARGQRPRSRLLRAHALVSRRREEAHRYGLGHLLPLQGPGIGSTQVLARSTAMQLLRCGP
jgi:GNAT superfamily N-acetyltransferase